MRIHLVALLLLLAALAGCSGKKASDDDGDHDGHGDVPTVPTLLLTIRLGNQSFELSSATGTGVSTSSSSSSSHHATSSTTTTAGGNATAGNATVGGNLTGNATAPSGKAPVNATFSLSAKGLANGTALTWILDFGDRNATVGGNASTPAGNASATAGDSTPGQATGNKLPASANHTYLRAGDFNVTYILRVGNSTAATLKATIHVENGTANATAGAPATLPFTAEGSITLGTQGPDACGAAESIDVGTHDWDLSAVKEIRSFTVHMDLGTTNIDSDIFLVDAAGVEVGHSSDFNQPGLGSGSPTEDFVAEGPFAPGVYTFIVRGCVAFEGSYTITASADVLE